MTWSFKLEGDMHRITALVLIISRVTHQIQNPLELKPGDCLGHTSPFSFFTYRSILASKSNSPLLCSGTSLSSRVL